MTRSILITSSVLLVQQVSSNAHPLDVELPPIALQADALGKKISIRPVSTTG
jgi:hypothetical protein